MSYTEDFIDLCKRVNAPMTDAGKIRHIMKGIDDDAFHMLVAKNTTTVAHVNELCESFDELLKQCLSTRHTSLQSADLSALEPGCLRADHSGLPQIQQCMREEVACQSSLVACVAEPASTLDPSLHRLIQAQVSEALPPPSPPPPVTGPLIYAATLNRRPARPMPTTSRPAASFYS